MVLPLLFLTARLHLISLADLLWESLCVCFLPLPCVSGIILVGSWVQDFPSFICSCVFHLSTGSLHVCPGGDRFSTPPPEAYFIFRRRVATGLHAFLLEVTTFLSKPEIARKVLACLLLLPHLSHEQEIEVHGEERARV